MNDPGGVSAGGGTGGQFQNSSREYALFGSISGVEKTGTHVKPTLECKMATDNQHSKIEVMVGGCHVIVT